MSKRNLEEIIKRLDVDDEFSQAIEKSPDDVKGIEFSTWHINYDDLNGVSNGSPSGVKNRKSPETDENGPAKPRDP